MTNKLIILFFTTFTCYGQTIKPDTIIYSALKLDSVYNLIKITQGKGSEIKELEGTSMVFSKIKDASDFDKGVLGCLIKVHIGDTLTFLHWEIEKEFKSDTPCHHCYGKITINQKNNLLTIRKCRVDMKNTPSYLERKYRIIKLTNNSFVIKDITRPAYNRHYFFKLK